MPMFSTDSMKITLPNSTPSEELCFGADGNLRRTATTAELPETTKLVVISKKIVSLQKN